MKFTDSNISIFASDVSTYLSCKHAINLQKQYRLDGKTIPQNTDPVLQILKQRGAEHESAYVNYLKNSNLICTDSNKKTLEETIKAMKDGVDVIVQGFLQKNDLQGYPDILLRVPGKSKFGNWHYEVQDTKLSLNTRTSSIIQLCFYTDLLESIQESEPLQFSVVMPGNENLPFKIEAYQYSDFKSYYSFVIKNFTEAIRMGIITYPDPVEHCSICNWWSVCNERRRADDHLSYVAGLRSSQIDELKNQQITTLEAFALANKILRPHRGSYENLLRKKDQAEIQYQGRISKSLIHKAVLPVIEDRGFSRLPVPSPGDIYLDLEGDAFFSGGSFEYLFGLSYQNNDINEYKCFWATTRSEEKESFIGVMEFILERLKNYPDLFIYHYGHYEPSTFKRLAHTYGVFELELDDLLRNGKFVDLHSVVKEALIASVERYSLKDIEKFARYTRSADLRDASAARKQLERSLQLNEFNSLPEQTIKIVQIYNQDDCLATQSLHVWLEGEREKLLRSGQSILRPSFVAEPPSEKTTKLEQRSKILYNALVQSIPPDRDKWNDDHKAKWLLANQLQYFRREMKTAYWEHFRLQRSDLEDLFEDRKALVGLKFSKIIDSSSEIPTHRYTFPDQETVIAEDDEVYVVNSISEENKIGIKFGTIVLIDTIRQIVDIKKTRATAQLHPEAIHQHEIIGTDKLWNGILDIARDVVDDFGGGLGRVGDYWCSKDLLTKRMPSLKNGTVGAFINSDETVNEAAIRIALNLNRSILPIQGPPGTGKTFTGAQIILSLIKEGKTIGVTAVSHRVITTLFEAIREQALDLGMDIKFFHKVSEKRDMPDWVTQLTSPTEKVLTFIKPGSIVGGTAWLWADDKSRGSVEYLVIDEAGQMSLSQALAASRAASNLILLGDPQQLEQPQRGAHPEGSGIAALTHILNGQQIMPEGQGLFLDTTRRINPLIAKFTSEAFYKGKLRWLPNLANQKISGGTLFDGGGLFYVPAIHQGNQNRSNEEIDVILKTVNNLLERGYWTNKDSETNKLTAGDILVVAPYNAQVDALREKLKQIDVGTVDRFQGREAPVVIYSLTASTVNDAPRGINFLFNPNRLNVATSRAKCICILVASPQLFEAECNTIEQMRWVNALCTYRIICKEINL